MNTSDLKIDLIKHISATENMNLLKELKRFLSLELSEREVYSFTPEQLQRVNESLEQYKQGKFLTQEEAEIDIQKWLKEEEEK